MSTPSSDAFDSSTAPPLTILGAGPAGALLSIFLAKRGHRVVAYERLPDLRRTRGASGRSINLALAARGIHALAAAGVLPAIEPLLIPMRGRMVHDGATRLLPYGQIAHEAIFSVSRLELTAALLDHAEREHQVEFRFRQTGISVDAKQRTLCMQDIPSGRLYSLPLTRVFGADGAGSVLRRCLTEAHDVRCSEELLAHGYKELTIAPGPNGEHRLDPNALHVWPRGDFMLIALPNRDGSFTATLFLPHDGAQGFGALDAESISSFFEREFPDARTLLPDLEQQFTAHPTGSMGTVRCARWSLDDSLVLVGDAAHAIVPFHGQGMNCAFEDCVELDALLGAHADWSVAFAEFERRRRPNTDAIADMALDNYVEMRATVRDPKFALQKDLSLELERRFPRQFIPRYSMVMFHPEIPYAVAQQRGRLQQRILEQLSARAAALADIDFELAARLIATELPPLDFRQPANANLD